MEWLLILMTREAAYIHGMDLFRKLRALSSSQLRLRSQPSVVALQLILRASLVGALMLMHYAQRRVLPALQVVICAPMRMLPQWLWLLMPALVLALTV